MLSFPASIRIFVYTGVTDMRRSFDRLAQMVEEHLGQDPESGHLYLFFNRRRDCVKLLLWEGDGFSIFYKKLEADCPHFSPFTEFPGSCHNLAGRPAAAGGMD